MELPEKQYAYEERDRYDLGGVYCFYPFDNALKKVNGEHFGVFKVGISSYTHNRLYSYHTALPAGFHLVAYLKQPTKLMISYKSEFAYYKAIENEIHSELGKPIFINTRKNNGKTEWFYTSIEKIEKAFRDARKKHGGKLLEYDLEDLPLHVDNQFLLIFFRFFFVSALFFSQNFCFRTLKSHFLSSFLTTKNSSFLPFFVFLPFIFFDF